MNTVVNLVKRLDALSLDLARDAGRVARDATAFVDLASDRATTIYRATPRAAKLAQIAAALFARMKWLRLVATARGHAGLRDEDHRDLARRAAAHAAELRGGIAKLGQLAACRPDLVGPIWAGELATLQDAVPPIDSSLIRARIEAELGAPIATRFATFDDAPLAAASLAQVHAATLPDGRRVVVKVQVPGIETAIAADIAALRAVASAVGELPGVDLATLADELSRALAAELDYLAEAAQLRAFRASGVNVPEPIAQLTTARVLTMTRLDGERLSTALEHATPAARDAVLAALIDEVAQQILVRGRVHADPHPGNFFVTEAGELALLDFGCVLELSRDERRAYARLVLAVAGKQRAQVIEQLAALGFVADDPERLAALAELFVGAMAPGASLDQLDWQLSAQLAVARQLGGLTIPRSFVLLGRVLATIAGLLAKHRPAIQLHALILRHLAVASAA